MGKVFMAEAAARIKESSVRTTPHRVAVLGILMSSDKHPTAEEIHKDLDGQSLTISLATVYNNLHTLCENGLAQELPFSSHSSRFDSDPSAHYHVICTSCGDIMDLHYPLLKEMEVLAGQLSGFVISGHRLEIYGICKKCCEVKS